MNSTPRWFACVGTALTASDGLEIAALLAADPLLADARIETIADWSRAGEFARADDYDSTWWNHEEEERERLWEQAAQRRGETELAAALAAIDVALRGDIARAAHAAADKAGSAGHAVVAAAIAAAMMASHHHALATLAGEGETHAFAFKRALFAAGRWPLGLQRGRYLVF